MPLQLLNLGVIIPRFFYRAFYTRTPRGNSNFFILAHNLCIYSLLTDYAELNAPPMINYGVVYPQAILMFVITMLYSVVQPLIVIFGAIYFGVAYVVYKYKLLFGQYPPRSGISSLIDGSNFSFLQALRISGTSLADNVHSSDLGSCHIPALYDWHFHAEEIIHLVFSPRSAFGWDRRVVLVCRQISQATQQICCIELGV